MSRPLTNVRGPVGDPEQALRAGAVGADTSIGELRLRIAELPLVRRTPQGPRQAVRVIVDGPAGPPVELRLRDGESIVDTATVVPGERQSVLLFAPEVSAPRELRLETGAVPVSITLHPPRKWRIYLVHHSHLDVGYTDPQDVVFAHHARYLDAAVELACQTQGWPDGARFRWNVEATLPLQRWLRSRPAAARRRFQELVREGAIEVTGLPFSMHTEAYSIDELARLLRDTDRLRAEHGLPITTAMQTDVPGATLALCELLASAGIDALSVAHNYAGRSVPYRHGGQELERPARWRSKSGKELLVWHTDTMYGSAYMEGVNLGLIDSYEKVAELLPEYLAALADRGYPYASSTDGWLALPPDVPLTRPPYPYDILHLRLTGEHADNGRPNLVPAEIVRRWNEEWAYPKLRMATNREFFDVARDELGDRIQTVEGDWTDWWADGIGSAARELAMNRDAQARAPIAQTLHTLADTLAGERTDWEPALDASYADMALFDEHTWGAANPWDLEVDGPASGQLQWQRKAGFALDAHDRAARLLDEGAVRIADVLATDQPAVAVFNPSASPRSDVARVFLAGEHVQGPIRVVDEQSGEDVPFELAEEARPRNRPQGRHLSFVARDVPGLGYRRYRLLPGTELEAPGADAGPIQNERYRLTVDERDGSLAGLRDRLLDRELIERESPFGFNQYVYDRYGSAPRFNHLSSRIPEQHGTWLLGSRSLAHDAAAASVERTPAGQRVTVRRQGDGAAWIETTYRLWHGLGRVDIENRLHKLPTYEKESVWFAFPFRMDAPQTWWETTGGIDGASAPRVPGSAAHMRAIRNWVSLSDGTTQVAWATADAPLIQLGMMHLPYSPFPPTFDADERDRATVFSWALNNIWDTNFPPRQGGEMRFRYALRSGEAGGNRLPIETGETYARPFVATLCAPGTGRLPATGSFVELEGADVSVVTIAPARDGGGVALFLHSLSPDAIEARVRFPMLPVTAAWAGDHLEREGAEVPVAGGEARLTIGPGEYRTLVLRTR